MTCTGLLSAIYLRLKIEVYFTFHQQKSQLASLASNNATVRDVRQKLEAVHISMSINVLIVRY